MKLSKSNKTHFIDNSIESVVATIAGSRVVVRWSNNVTPSYNSLYKVINLPFAGKDSCDDIRTYAYHEAGHARFTPSSHDNMLDTNEVFHHIVNALEDVRMEKEVMRVYFGTSSYFAATRKKYYKDLFLNNFAKNPEKHPLWSIKTITLMFYAYGFDIKPLAHLLDNDDINIFINGSIKAKKFNAVLDAAHKLYDKWALENQKEHQNVQQVLNLDEAENDENKTDSNETSNESLDSKNIQADDNAEKTASTIPDITKQETNFDNNQSSSSQFNQQKTNLDQFEDNEFKTISIYAKELIEEQLEGIDISKNLCLVRKDVYEIKPDVAINYARIRAARILPNTKKANNDFALISSVRNAVMAKLRQKTVRHLDRGFIDSTLIDRIYTSDRIFSQVTQAKKLKTAVSIVIDSSSSMYIAPNRYSNAIKIARAIGNCLKLFNVNFEIVSESDKGTGFTDVNATNLRSELIFLKKFNHPLSPSFIFDLFEALHLINEHNQFLNSEAINMAVNRIKQQSASRKIIIMITDGIAEFGSIDREYLEKATKDSIINAKKQNIEVYAIGTGVNEKPFNNCYQDATDKIVANPNDLVKSVIPLFKSIMLKLAA